eukprot:m.28365 g.28365  ORF g.28365 m.28365 type:complete len:376 (+) comp11831_c0_seq3:195-1322(+)
MAERDEATAHRRRRDVTRSHQTESKALDQMVDEEDAQSENSRREARALRLEARRKQFEEEERAKMHAKDYEVYKVALDAAKERAAERRAKLEKEAKSSTVSKEQDTTTVLEEVNDICQTIINGPDKDNQSVQMLYQRVLLLSSRLKSSLEMTSRHQTNRVHAQYERETLRDQLDESQEEIAKLQSQLRKAKDEKQAKLSDLSKSQRRVAELEAIVASTESGEGTGEGTGLVAASSGSPGKTGQKNTELDVLQNTNAELTARVQALEEELVTAKSRGNGGMELDASLDMTNVDPDVAGQRMKMLETQKKRLKQELSEAEEREDALRADKRKLAREVRRLEGDAAALQERINAKDEQLKKLRERRRMNVSLLDPDEA